MSIFDRSDTIAKKMKHVEETFIEEQKDLLDGFLEKHPEMDRNVFKLFKKVMLTQTRECYNRGKLDMLAFIINEMRLVTEPYSTKTDEPPKPRKKGA